MTEERVIPEEVRQRVKRPLGELLRGTPSETRPALLKLVSQRSWVKVVAVGDGVTSELLAMGLRPDVAIVDGNIERRPVDMVVIQGAEELHCRNRPGTISREAYETVSRSLSMSAPVVVKVDGEEDLLGLVVMAEAPLGSLMLYGQPGEGVVAVHIDAESRTLGRRLIEASSRTR